MNDIHSLPESLRASIQEAAENILQPESHPAINIQQAPAAPVDPIRQIVIEIARQSPELFAALIVANSQCLGIETTETEETVEDKFLDIFNDQGSHRGKKLQAVKTRKTIHRQVRFLRDGQGSLRDRS